MLVLTWQDVCLQWTNTSEYYQVQLYSTAEGSRIALNISYYLGSDQNCTSRIPLSGQCQCLQHNLKKKCTFWEPSLSPNTIPSTAQYLGKSDINSYHNVSEWNYYYPPFASTINVWTVQVKDTNQSFVTRTVGARVQTDYTNVIVGKPKESVFNIPKECKWMKIVVWCTK